jgi:hypothetical protein
MHGDLVMRTRETTYEVGDNTYDEYITLFDDWTREQNISLVQASVSANMAL